jgi:hypothetical protein
MGANIDPRLAADPAQAIFFGSGVTEDLFLKVPAEHMRRT